MTFKRTGVKLSTLRPTTFPSDTGDEAAFVVRDAKGIN